MGQNRFNEEMADLEAHFGSGYIEEVLGEVKSGKEATVYCCRGGYRLQGRLVAAKIYRARMVRQFANAAMYNAGRNRQPWKREARAMATKTRVGRDLAFGKWVADEVETLRILHAAGADVPEPYSHADRIILMEYIGSDEAPAPLLVSAEPSAPEAQRLFGRVMTNVETMLRHDRIHGDLSPYNVLYDGTRVCLIDFPQAVDARFNPNAQALLDRDVERICQWAARFGVNADGWRYARDLWQRYIRSDL